MNSVNSYERQIRRVSSKKWDRAKDGETSKGNNVRNNCLNQEDGDEEEEVIDPYTKKRRESLKNFAYDIAGKVSRLKLNML